MLNVKVTPPTGTIVFERGDCCNALSRELVQEISQAFDDLHQEKRVRVIVLTGSGPHFCSGLDLKQLDQTRQSDQAMGQWFEDAQAFQGLLEKMLRCPQPIIAAVDGVAFGAGLALVLASDLVVASHRARFAVPAPRLGLVSGLTIPLLNFRLGGGTASRLLIGGDEISASEAKDLGLVHHVVEPEQVWVRATTWADSISETAGESIQLTKKVLNEMVGEGLSTMLSSGAAATASAMTTEAAAEGVSAFVGQRKPNFP